MTPMTRLALGLAAAALLAVAAPRGASAAPERVPAWCVFYDPWTYNCGFYTLQQCLDTISGAGGICQPNPRAPDPAAEPRPRRQKRSHAN